MRLDFGGYSQALFWVFSEGKIDGGDASGNKKRMKDSENGGSQKIKAVEEFRGMGIRQLHEQAALQGVSSIGSEKELIERLYEDSKDQDLEEIPEANEKENESEKEKEKIVNTTKKGSAVLDQWLTDHIKAHYHVLQLGSEFGQTVAFYVVRR